MQTKLHAITSILFFLFPALVFAQARGTISGTVNSFSTQKPIAGASLSLEPGNLRSVSDSSGQFTLKGIEPGTYRLTIQSLGYENRRYDNLVITSGNILSLQAELNPNVTQLGTVVVSSKRATVRATSLESPLSIQRLTTEEIKANPGGNFDISKVIQSLPGVGGGAAGGSFRNDIIIRGGAPSENVFYLDGIEVPIINHFSTQGSGGGPQGILNVSFIEDVKLSTSAFDARYDNTLSSVFQFKQKNGNKERLQGNIRLSGTELAATFDGPLTKNTTFLASARRSYLQLLFKALDLPIRPNYWDFQFKTNTKLTDKLSLTVLGIGAIDEFSFAAPKEATPEKLYVINSNPLINQWSYTVGATLKKLIPKGYWNLSISRNTLDNSADKYLDNENPDESSRTFGIQSRETENKFRFDVTQNVDKIRLSYGLVAQYVDFDNRFFQILRPTLTDSQGDTIQEGITLRSNTNAGFWRYGGFVQAGTRVFDERLAISAGIRLDANSLSNSSQNPFQQFSPRISLSYAITRQWNLSASYGIYYRLPGYPQLAFRDSFNNILQTNPGDYIRSTHYVAGVEFLPSSQTRFTLEGFYKKYSQYPVSIPDGISIANKGTEFGAIGNEPVQQDGEGRAYGIELFAQQKLSKRLFGIVSYTLYWSEFSGLNGILEPASWDNRHLMSVTLGYKLPRNWEMGLKFRYQGQAPYSPYDETESKLNYLTLGTGVFDFNRVNDLRLAAFHAADLRVDKKWNLKKLTLDLFLDIQNLYGFKAAGVPQYTFQRTADNSGFATTDGQPIRQDGSNGIPVLLDNRDGTILPTIGFIVEF